MNRLVLIAVAGAIALMMAWLLPRLQQPLTPVAVAMELMESGRAAEAVHLLDDKTLRGVAEYRANRFRRAAIEFVQVEDATALYNLGTTYARLAEWRGARAAFERTLRLDPDHADAAFNLSLVLQAEAQERANEDAQRQTRSLGSEDSPKGVPDDSGSSEGETKEDGEARPTPEAVATDKPANQSGATSSPGRAGDTAQLPDQAAGHGSLGEGDDGTAAQHTGAAAIRIRRQSAQEAEVLLRAIRDDPARVLRARLYAIHLQRQLEASQ